MIQKFIIEMKFFIDWNDDKWWEREKKKKKKHTQIFEYEDKSHVQPILKAHWSRFVLWASWFWNHIESFRKQYDHSVIMFVHIHIHNHIHMNRLSIQLCVCVFLRAKRTHSYGSRTHRMRQQINTYCYYRMRWN